MIKGTFEKSLLSARYFVLLPVIFGMISTMILFVMATYDILAMIMKVWLTWSAHSKFSDVHALVVGEIIGAVDLYLIAVVLLIFSFGLYELFISEVGDEDKPAHIPNIMAVHSLDELKDKLAKVIIMVLVVSYFRRVFSINYSNPLDMMYFAISIVALSIGVYLMHKDSKQKKLLKMKG